MANEEISVYGILKNIKDIWKYLLSKWIVIVIFGFGGGGVGVTLSLLGNPKYLGHLTFVIEESAASSSSGIASIASSFGIAGASTSAGLFSTTNLIEFLKSRNLVEKTLLMTVEEKGKKMTFAELYIKANGFRDGWADFPKIKKIRFLPDEPRSEFIPLKDSILCLLYANLVESELMITIPNEENMFIAIDLMSKNETFSKQFPEKLLDVASNYYIETKTKKAKLSVDILQRQVDSVRHELFSAISGVAASNDQIFGLNPSMNVQRVPSAQKQVDVQANSAILTELVKNLELSKMSLLNQTPVIQTIDKPILPLETEYISIIEGIGWGGIAGGFIIVFILMSRKFVKDSVAKGKQKEEEANRANGENLSEIIPN